jgi:hypothetical protein
MALSCLRNEKHTLPKIVIAGNAVFKTLLTRPVSSVAAGGYKFLPRALYYGYGA